VNGFAIVGAGGHARVVIDVLRSCDAAVWGCVDDNLSLRGGECCGVPVRGPVDMLVVDRPRIDGIIVAIGDNENRVSLARLVRAAGFLLISAVHPSAIIARNAHIGAGSVVMAGVVIQPGAVLGENVIVNTGSTVDHDCVLEEGAHLAPGVHLAGSVRVGARSMLGIGTVVIPNRRVGRDCVVGAGSVVIRDLPDGTVAFGAPAVARRQAS
jgi:sugar O-acyltransferase (sialic acid O-acetyltransferase NeuD family)